MQTCSIAFSDWVGFQAQYFGIRFEKLILINYSEYILKAFCFYFLVFFQFLLSFSCDITNIKYLKKFIENELFR